MLGVRCIPLLGVTANDFAQPCDALIGADNGPAELGPMLRPHLPASTRLVLWMQHAFDQPAARRGNFCPWRQVWDAIVCISEWQKATYVQQLGVSPGQIAILRNAMAPPFQDMFTSEEELAVPGESLIALFWPTRAPRIAD